MSNQVKCLSNLKQIGTSFLMYSNENRQFLPFASWNDSSKLYREDWFWWQKIRFNKVDESSIQPYLQFSAGSLDVLKCPSDSESLNRVKQNSAALGPYTFSYVMNWWIAGGATNAVNVEASHPQYKVSRKLVNVRSSSSKVLLYEEDESTIDDTMGVSWHPTTGPNLLALRHDTMKKRDNDSSLSATFLPNPGNRGNAVFADGHGEFVARDELHTARATVGNVE